MAPSLSDAVDGENELPCLPGHPGSLRVAATTVLGELDVDPSHSRIAAEPLDLA